MRQRRQDEWAMRAGRFHERHARPSWPLLAWIVWTTVLVIACDTAHGLHDPTTPPGMRPLVTDAAIYTADVDAEEGQDGEPIPADDQGIVRLEAARVYLVGFVLARTRPGHCIAYQVSTSWPGGTSAAGACQPRREAERTFVRLVTPIVDVEPDIQRITIFVEERGPSLEAASVEQVELDVRFLR